MKQYEVKVADLKISEFSDLREMPWTEKEIAAVLFEKRVNPWELYNCSYESYVWIPDEKEKDCYTVEGMGDTMCDNIRRLLCNLIANAQ